MCIVIDANSLAPVFEPNCIDHIEYKPVSDWILKGKGHAVFGGSKYRQELINANKYMKLFRLLKDSGRAYEICCKCVDEREAEVKAMTSNNGCNDHHLIAILGVSGCRLLCSRDARSFVFIKNKRNYPKGATRPRIYTGLKNKKLISKSSIVPLRNID
jgi:hypothetical protein